MLFKKKGIPINTGGASKKVPWRLIMVLLFGLGVSVSSWLFLQNYLAKNQKTEVIAVPVIDIPPFTTITSEFITKRTILAGAREPNAVVNAQELIGKIPKTTLYKGEQVRRERLGEAAETGRYEVTINVDPVRANGVKPGDVVDLYYEPNETTPGALLAADLIVKAVRDTNGNELGAQPQVPTQAPKTISMVALSVPPDKAPVVVRGSANGSKSMVLVKKRGGQ